MQSIKPVVDRARLLGLLAEAFEQPIQHLALVGGGLVAQTYSFWAAGVPYILRFVTESIEVSYQKEAFIHAAFASPAIPIPPILKVGRTGGLFYAISRKLPGRGLQSLSRVEYAKTLPGVMETLYAIHQVDVRGWRGYGWLDDHGTGMFASWRAFLAKIIKEERADGFYGEWHTLFKTSFLERDFFETVYQHMLDRLDHCPEDRHLVHGGYGYNNVLAREGCVTAVLDWIDAMYGDFVYDIAYIDFWPSGIDLAERFRRLYQARGVGLSHYQERLACYKAYIGLDALRFFAKTDDYAAYQAARQILQGLFDTDPSRGIL